MSAMCRRGFLAAALSLAFAAGVLAQPAKLQGFATPEAAATHKESYASL